MSAIAALKGYRTQFLYSLHRIVFGVTDDYVYHIEGEFEDLDIIDNNGKYVECLQVKNLSDSLTFSDLFSAKDSFFKRIIQVSSTNPNVIAKVISFGSVSDELSDKKKLGQKLKSKGFHDNKIQTILAHYTKPMLVSEKSLYNDIVGKLKTEHPFIDPVIAVELLLSWICFSAEKQIPVTRITLLQEIQRIGIFVQERIKFHSQYGSTIIPLQVKNIDSDNIQLLKEGYISGISAKYEHILAGLDVIRYDKLNEINKAFATNNIVFVHGASGQGKSSLAYRYLSNNYIDGTMFELKLSSNFNDVRDTINSLDGLCKGLNIPVIIYIDVLPDNNHWNEVVKEFSNKSNLMFLITLRQETWNKTLLGEDYSFKDIELIFDKEEARSLYNSISKNEKDLINASFEESWMRFGNKGLLLEYMYFLNHGDKLKNKLGNQVLRLETDQKITELKILRYVCLADLYNSKVNCKKLIDKLGLDSVLAQSYITNLEKEYLLEHIEDSMYLSGMHYVRSEILCEILFDENKFINKTDYINALISLVNESDLHSFLLNSFDNNYDVISLFKEIKRNDLHFSWVGVANILKALLWKGVYDFVFVDNYLLFEGLYKKLNSGWFIGLPYDYSGTMDGTIYNSMRSIFKKMNPEILVFFDELSQKFSPKDDVYQYAKQWLSYLGGQTIDIASNADISAIGIYCFWAGHLGLTNNKIIINNPELIKIANNTNTSIEDISELIFGLESYGYSKEIISSLREFAIKKLREKYTISYLNINGNIDCIYVYNLVRFDVNSKELGGPSNILNDTSVRILELLRKIYPNCKQYNARCVGMNCFDQYILNNDDYDPSLKHISKNNLPINHLVQINQLIINLYDYTKRVNTWNEYTKCVLEFRRNYCDLMDSLVDTFIEYFKTSDIRKFIPFCEKLGDVVKQDTRIALPKSISDRWGYEKEQDKSNPQKDKVAYCEIVSRFSIAANYVNYIDYQSRYFNAIKNFVDQFEHNIVNIAKINQGQFVEYNSNLPYMHLKDALLVRPKFVKEINDKFKKYYESKEIESLSIKEHANLVVILNCWTVFANNKSSNFKLPKIASDKIGKIKKDFENKIFQVFAKIKHHKQNLKYKIGDGKLLIAYDVSIDNLDKDMSIAFCALREILESDYFSLKRIVIESNFEEVLFIPLIHGNPINKICYRFPIYSMADKDRTDEDTITTIDYMHEIDKNVLDELNMQTWDSLIPAIKNYQQVQSVLSSIVIFSKQIKELAESDIDREGMLILDKYKNECLLKLNEDIALAKESLLNLNGLLQTDLYTNIRDILNQNNIVDQKLNVESCAKILAQDLYQFANTRVVPESN